MDKTWELSLADIRVGVLPQICPLLSYLAQPTPLKPDYAVFIQAVNCVNEVQNELSFLKDAWFTSALLVPPMAELVCSKLFTKKYKFTTYVSLLDLCLVFGIGRSRNSWGRRSMGFPNFGK